MFRWLLAQHIETVYSIAETAKYHKGRKKRINMAFALYFKAHLVGVSAAALETTWTDSTDSHVPGFRNVCRKA